jgi:hypothetical protein
MKWNEHDTYWLMFQVKLWVAVVVVLGLIIQP